MIVIFGCSDDPDELENVDVIRFDSSLAKELRRILGSLDPSTYYEK